MMYSVAQRRSLVGTHILQDKRITLASERPQLTLSFKKEDPRKVEVKTPTKRSKKMFYFASRDEVSPFRLVAPGSRPCGWWRFVTRWDCITFNCFCLVSEPPGSLCAYSWLFVFFCFVCVFFVFKLLFVVVECVCLLQFPLCVWRECQNEKEWQVTACFLLHAYAALECDCL